MKRILIVFGTRPEAIKMAPLVKAFRNHADKFIIKICVTAQHREMLDQVLNFFEIETDYDLDLMKPNQNLFRLTADVIEGLKPVLEEYQPDYVFVHGDTTTSMAAAIASFYAETRVCHVEAGLRTNNKWAPFPEEINRQITGRVADLHFAPTENAKNNLLNEGIFCEKIFITGNTVIDALLWTKERLESYEDNEIIFLKKTIDPAKRMILVTGHRRENFGDGFVNICYALKELAKREDIQIVYPVHLNPNVQQPVYDILGECINVRLISPLSYPAFVWLMDKSYLILTDSGGVQEEAPSLGKPVLVMRETTERPEAIKAETVRLVGTSSAIILESITNLLDSKDAYSKMSKAHNPYGDGRACERIISHLIAENV